MSVFFQDGTKIYEITIEGLNAFSLEVRREQRKLSAELLTDSVNGNFRELYLSWIQACVDNMWLIDHGRSPDCKRAPCEEHLRIMAFFEKDADERGQKEFLQAYRKMLIDPICPHIGNKARSEEICARLDQKMKGVAPHLHLRTAAVCLLTNSLPEEIFAEGEGWADILCAASTTAKYETNIYPVQEGDAFLLDLDVDLSQGAVLVPKTLQNKSSQVCRISVTYEDIDHLIKIPPYGSLRAVFSDSSCTKLAGLKGNISCCGTNGAIVQKSEKDGMKLLYINRRSGESMEYPQTGLFWDASADKKDGITGAVVLGSDEMYSTIDSSLELQRDGKTELPIRCYRAGNQWAWLYADGRLVSDLEKQDDSITDVSAVVEDGERGLLICRRDEAVDHRGNLKKKITKREFAQIMLSHFPQGDDEVCEVQATQFTKWVINSRGKLERIK